MTAESEDDFCPCEFSGDEPDGEESWHYPRTCHRCGGTWFGLHCPHDGAQNNCPHCGQRPRTEPWPPHPTSEKHMTATENHDDQEPMWVESKLLADGRTYAVGINLGQDIAYCLTRPEALDYVTTILSASGAATYDAAVFQQFKTELGAPPQDAGAAVVSLRRIRGKDTWQAGPVQLTPGVSGASEKPFIACTAGDKKWQWNPADIEQHARQVLECCSTIEYDNAYRTYLEEYVGLDPDTAGRVIIELGKFREDAEQS